MPQWQRAKQNGIMAKILSMTGKALRQIDKFAVEGKLPKGYHTTKMEKSEDFLTITGRNENEIFQWILALKHKDKPMTCVKYTRSDNRVAVWDYEKQDINYIEVLEEELTSELNIDLSIIEDEAE